MYQDSIDNISAQNMNSDESASFIEKLMLNWAEVEAYKIKDREKVQELMESLVKANGYMSTSWMNYLRLLRVLPDSER